MSKCQAATLGETLKSSVVKTPLLKKHVLLREMILTCMCTVTSFVDAHTNVWWVVFFPHTTQKKMSMGVVGDEGNSVKKKKIEGRNDNPCAYPMCLRMLPSHLKSLEGEESADIVVMVVMVTLCAVTAA